ncbi:MAG: AraC family transcriptional regulator [Pseudomonadota bacterium]
MLDLLSDILTRFSLRGTLYFRTSFSGAWGVEVPEFENVARFHLAHRGECMVKVSTTGESLRLAEGDLVIIPHGASHCLLTCQQPSPPVLELDEILEKSGYGGSGVLVYGSEDDDCDTQLICGHFSFAAGSRHIIFDRLPPYILIRDYGQTAGKWMEASLRLIGDEAGGRKIGGDLIALKMSEVIFTQALRTFLETSSADAAGLSAFADPQLTRALSAFHKAPAEHWTVDRLARIAGLSRTGFAQLFVKKLELTPMQYLTAWRMQLAKNELKEHNANLAAVAASVGYASDAAFAKAFKKECGLTPAQFRRDTNAIR